MTATPAVPGALKLTSLTGKELVNVATPGPMSAVSTVALIAALAGLTSTNMAVSSLTTVGAGTITAAMVKSQIVQRGGVQTAAFADTTDTAAAIVAALPAGAPANTSLLFIYNNGTTGAGGYASTLTAGSGVTVTGNAVILPRTTGFYLVQATNVTSGSEAVTFTYLGSAFHASATGTFICNGATPVTVTDAHLTPSSNITVTLQTVGGTVGAVPAVKTVTPGTGFTIAGTASDTSTYQYTILG